MCYAPFLTWLGQFLQDAYLERYVFQWNSEKSVVLTGAARGDGAARDERLDDTAGRALTKVKTKMYFGCSPLAPVIHLSHAVLTDCCADSGSSAKSSVSSSNRSSNSSSSRGNGGYGGSGDAINAICASLRLSLACCSTAPPPSPPPPSSSPSASASSPTVNVSAITHSAAHLAHLLGAPLQLPIEDILDRSADLSADLRFAICSVLRYGVDWLRQSATSFSAALIMSTRGDCSFGTGTGTGTGTDQRCYSAASQHAKDFRAAGDHIDGSQYTGFFPSGITRQAEIDSLSMTLCYQLVQRMNHICQLEGELVEQIQRFPGYIHAVCPDSQLGYFNSITGKKVSASSSSSSSSSSSGSGCTTTISQVHFSASQMGSGATGRASEVISAKGKLEGTGLLNIGDVLETLELEVFRPLG